MSGNAMIDFAIGVMLMYLLLSLVCSVINEFIATLSGLRASTLKNALQTLLDVPDLRARFYDHGLIDGSNRASGGGHASYFSGRTFAMALMGSLDPAKQ